MNSLIFLDFDGVLKSIRTAIAFKDFNNMLGTSLAGSLVYPVDLTTRKSFNLDPIAIELLRNFVEKYDAKIVISSTWRVRSCLEHFYQMFDLYDWDTRDIIIGFTPITNAGYRGDDIEEWFKLNPEYNNSKYVILDDSEDFNIEQKKYFVKTDLDIGLHYKDIELAEKIMGSPCPTLKD